MAQYWLDGKPLIAGPVDAMCEAGIDRVFVVTGYQAPETRAALAKRNCSFIAHPGWAAGMGASIAAGVRGLRETIEAAVATSGMANKLSARCPEASLFMTGAIVAAIIEFLEAPRIAEADQAQLFAMSASLDHQAAACDWFIEACAPTPASPVHSLRSEGPTLH